MKCQRQQHGDGEHLGDHVLHQPRPPRGPPAPRRRWIHRLALVTVSSSTPCTPCTPGTVDGVARPVTWTPMPDEPQFNPVAMSAGCCRARCSRRPTPTPRPASPTRSTRRPGARKVAVSEVLVAYPRFLAGWATLGDLGDATRSSATPCLPCRATTGGSTRLRANGWRGLGLRALGRRRPTVGFLRCAASGSARWRRRSASTTRPTGSRCSSPSSTPAAGPRLDAPGRRRRLRRRAVARMGTRQGARRRRRGGDGGAGRARRSRGAGCRRCAVRRRRRRRPLAGARATRCRPMPYPGAGPLGAVMTAPGAPAARPRGGRRL